MKPLELTVYPEGGCETAAHCALKRGCVECVDDVDKRLTDAELAAEKWHAATHATYARARVDACLDNPLPITADKAEDIVGILHRFATLPHYDEADQ